MKFLATPLVISCGRRHLWHHVILDGHGDDVDADDGRDGQVEVLAAGDRVESKSRSRVARPVRQRPAFYRHKHQFHMYDTIQVTSTGRRLHLFKILHLLNAVLKLYYSTGASLNICNDSVMRFRSFSRKRNINTLVTVTVTVTLDGSQDTDLVCRVLNPLFVALFPQYNNVTDKQTDGQLSRASLRDC